MRANGLRNVRACQRALRSPRRPLRSLPHASRRLVLAVSSCCTCINGMHTLMINATLRLISLEFFLFMITIGPCHLVPIPFASAVLLNPLLHWPPQLTPPIPLLPPPPPQFLSRRLPDCLRRADRQHPYVPTSRFWSTWLNPTTPNGAAVLVRRGCHSPQPTRPGHATGNGSRSSPPPWPSLAGSSLPLPHRRWLP